MNGEGSIYQRASDGRWSGSIVVTNELGQPKRRTVRAKTKDGARQELKRFMEEQERLQAEGLPPIDTATTVRHVLDRWHGVIVAARGETTAINCRYVIVGHLVGFVLHRPTITQARGASSPTMRALCNFTRGTSRPLISPAAIS
jgi:hypothetical protein